MKHGFFTVAAAIPAVRVADVQYNVSEMEAMIAQAEGQGVEVIVFPELSLTGYSCQDLFRQQLLLDKAEAALLMLLDFTRKLDIICIVGLPVRIDSLLYNCAAVVQQGTLLGLVAKTYLPNYGEFYEKRWFASSTTLRPQSGSVAAGRQGKTVYLAGTPVLVTHQPQVFVTADGVRFGIEICEDLWAPLPPSNQLAVVGADVVFNLSATDELSGKHQYLMSLIRQQSARTISGYVYSSCGFGESTQDVVYGGNAIVVENGRLLCEAERFSFKPQMRVAQIDIDMLRAERQNNTTFRTAVEQSGPYVEVGCKPVQQREFRLLRRPDPHPFVPADGVKDQALSEILDIQVAGLAKRLHHTGCRHAVIGISGGLDSTLALLVTVMAFRKLGLDVKGIVGVTMPGLGTSSRTHDNADKEMQLLGITAREISIAKAVAQHFEDIGHDPGQHDVTYENAQARERTQILMDVANQVGGMVIGTGDLSELALGWATYNGDHMSMYGVNAGVPKTLIQHLVRYVAFNLESLQLQPAVPSQLTQVLLDVVETPISPELTPADTDGRIAQKTEDLVGPYELHDFFLYYILRYGFPPRKVFVLAQQAFSGMYDDETIKHWLTTFCRRFFAQQFKRSCLPDGPKVGIVSLSPRGDWRMPSDACSALWLKECEALG
ncbi:MAG: NAD(+) synthase [Prevotella sp.]|nr:NAD(+) synthase [Prevotella sp.]